MKWIRVITLFSCILLSTAVFGQEAKMPRWVSEKGYWVIESNINNRNNHIIWFYNNDDQLVYKETLSSVKLNPNKRRVRLKLKAVLESAVWAWEDGNGDPMLKQNLVRSAL